MAVPRIVLGSTFSCYNCASTTGYMKIIKTDEKEIEVDITCNTCGFTYTRSIPAPVKVDEKSSN